MTHLPVTPFVPLPDAPFGVCVLASFADAQENNHLTANLNDEKPRKF